MYRQQISRKISPSLNRTTVSSNLVSSQIYEPLSLVVQRAQQEPENLSIKERQQLESSIGTRATQKILAGEQTSWVPEFKGISGQIGGDSSHFGAPIQAKLTVGQPNDKYEQEADRVADQIMRMSELDNSSSVNVVEQIHPLRIQRMCTECEEEEEERIYRKEAGGQTPTVTPRLEARLDATKGGGQPLPESVRSYMEPRFGVDFSEVRVHTNAWAAESAQALNARAYTVGRDIVFGSGQYVPETSAGQRLLAHELAHTVQQRSPGQGVPLLSPRRTSEQAADNAAREAIHGRVMTQLSSTSIGIARQSLTFNVEDLNEDTLLDEIEKVTNRLKPFEKLTIAGRLEDEEYLTKLLAAFDKKASDKPHFFEDFIALDEAFGDFIVLNEARAVLRKVRSPREQRTKLASFVGFPDNVEIRATQKLLERPSEFDVAERKELLTIGFSMMDPDTATAVRETITNPRLKRGKKVRSGFQSLSLSTREELLSILDSRISASPTVERPGVMGTGNRRTGGMPYYIVRHGVTIDEIASYLSDHPILPDILAQLNDLPRGEPLKGGTLVRVPTYSATSPAAKRDIEADVAKGRYISGTFREGGKRTHTRFSDLGFKFEEITGGVSLTENEIRAMQQTLPQDPLFVQGLREGRKKQIERDRQLAQRLPSPILSLFFPTSKLYFKNPRLEIQDFWYSHQAQVNLRGFEAGTNLYRNSAAVAAAVNLLPLVALESAPLLLKGGPALLSLLGEELILARLAIQAVPKVLQIATTTGLGAYYANPLLYNELGLIGISSYIGAEGDLGAILQDPFLIPEIIFAYLQGGTSGRPRNYKGRDSATGQSTQPEIASQPSSTGRTSRAQPPQSGGKRTMPGSIKKAAPLIDESTADPGAIETGDIVGSWHLESQFETLKRLTSKQERGISFKGGKSSRALLQTTPTRKVEQQLEDLQGTKLKRGKYSKAKPKVEPPLERLGAAGDKRPLTEAERAAGFKKAPGHELSFEHRRRGKTIELEKEEARKIEPGRQRSGLDDKSKPKLTKRLTFEEQGRLHTEYKVIEYARKYGKPGDSFYMDGVRVTCKPQCQPNLRAAAIDLDITFIYRAAGETWTFFPSGLVTVKFLGRRPLVVHQAD